MAESRTKEELENPDYNYYFAFSIDPSETNAANIEKIMAAKKNTFTEGTPFLRRLKELYEEALTKMKDKAQRDIEFKAAKEFKLEGAHETVKLIIRGSKIVYKSALKRIADSSGKWLKIEEIENKISYLKNQGIKIVDDLKSSLDLLTYDNIEKLLKTAGSKDLYDLFGIDRNAGKSDIEKAIKEKYDSVSGKTGPKPTAINQICGIAKNVFKDDNSKKYYNIYLATKEIWIELALLKSNGITEIPKKDLTDYIDKAKKALPGVDVDFIEVLLAEGLNFYKMIPQGGGDGGIDFEDCPKCKKAYNNNDNIKQCPACGEPLEVICWNCGGKAPNTIKKNTCPSCGAMKTHSARFEDIVKKIESLLVKPNVSITDVQTEINNLKNILPDYKKAPSSKIAKKAAEYEQIIDKKKKHEETVGKAYRDEYNRIQELVSLKKIMEAVAAVAALKNKFPTEQTASTDALAAQINAIAANAKARADRAKTLAAQNNEDAAIAEVAEALKIAVDFNDAIQIIAKFPPKAPSGVNAVLKENSVHVTWNQSGSQKMTLFTVIRKNGSKPTSVSDGTVIASELGVNSFEDKTIISDTPYFYGVFSARMGVNSPVVCTNTQVIAFFDVSNVKQEIVSGKIVVKWENPLNVSDVIVRRKKGLNPVSGREDGQVISVKNKESFEDSDFDKAGNSYLIICVYKNSKGVNYSKGVSRTFKSYEELKPLANVKIEQNGTTSFTLTSDKVISGKRGIYYSTQEINCKIGSNLQVAEFRNFYKEVKEASLFDSDENTANFNLPPDKVYFVYPVVSNEQLLIVSNPVNVNTIIGISQVKLSESSSEVLVSGQIHPTARRIIAKVSNTAFPVSLKSQGDEISVLKEDFIKNGGITLKLKTNTDNYVAIFVEIESSGIKSVTNGVKLSKVISLREKITVRFAMNYAVSASKAFTVKIDFQSDGPGTIPELMLVKGSPRPLDKNAGQLVERTPVLTLKRGMFGGKYTASHSIKAQPCAVNTKFALFPSTDDNLLALKEVKSL